MKLTPALKRILLSTLFLLYASGTLTWILTHWFLSDSGLGPEPSPFRVWWLEIHSVIGMWFMGLFGYLVHSHVRPSWRRRKRRKSGGLLTGVLLVLFATVPFLFYLSHEGAKAGAAWVHTYLGLAAAIPFFLHYYLVARD